MQSESVVSFWPKLLATHESHDPVMAIDREHIYFVDDHSVLSIPLDGRAPREFAGDHPSSIAVEDNAVYFTTGVELRRVPKKWGFAKVLYRGNRGLSEVQLFGGFAYVLRNANPRESEGSAIVRVSTAAVSSC
jgi:hypothetical protein